MMPTDHLRNTWPPSLASHRFSQENALGTHRMTRPTGAQIQDKGLYHLCDKRVWTNDKPYLWSWQLPKPLRNKIISCSLKVRSGEYGVGEGAVSNGQELLQALKGEEQASLNHPLLGILASHSPRGISEREPAGTSACQGPTPAGAETQQWWRSSPPRQICGSKSGDLGKSLHLLESQFAKPLNMGFTQVTLELYPEDKTRNVY